MTVLAAAEASRASNPDLTKKDYEAYQQEYAASFAAFPKTLPELLEHKLVHGLFTVTPKGKAAKGARINSLHEMQELVRLGYVEVEGLRYEDFLPVSAAGIFASNLGQYGTKSTASQKRVYTKETLERIMERPIIESDALYSEMEAESIKSVRTELGLTGVAHPDKAVIAGGK